jgi:hypothetical protein
MSVLKHWDDCVADQLRQRIDCTVPTYSNVRLVMAPQLLFCGFYRCLSNVNRHHGHKGCRSRIVV